MYGMGACSDVVSSRQTDQHTDCNNIKVVLNKSLLLLMNQSLNT